MNYSVINLGCKVNRVESDAASAKLSTSMKRTSADLADIVVVNTCTVTADAEKKTRKAVRQALRANENSKVIVTGCASAIDSDFYSSLSERIEVVPKALLNERLLELSEKCANSNAREILRIGSGYNTRVGVKVQDGCNNACTYCIVHVARGRATSVPLEDVVNECVTYASRGVPEIVLTGINLGSYEYVSKGSSNKYDLTHLLENLLEATEKYENSEGNRCRFRISSIEPCDVSEKLIDLLATSEGLICRHLHLPLQSGCTKVLREMARPYTAEKYAQLIEQLKNRVPEISITTDMIVGFPGETCEEHEQSMSFAKHCGFSKIHIFPYSKRQGTPAATRNDQVSSDEKTHRAAQLRTLSDELRKADREKRKGTVELAVVESSSAATTESYHEVEPPHNARPGQLVSVIL